MNDIQIDIFEMKQTIEQMKKSIEKLEKQVNDSYYDNVTIETQYYNNVPPTCAYNPYNQLENKTNCLNDGDKEKC